MTDLLEQDRSEPGSLETWSFFGLLTIAVLRMLTTFEAFPYWSTDPLVRFSPLVGLSAGTGAACDCLSILLSALLLFALSRRGHIISWLQVILWTLGAGVAFVHIALRCGLVIQHAVSGLPWIAALAAALAMHAASHDARHRRLLIAVVSGLAAIFVCKSIVQVYIEHPAMVEAFKRDRLAIFAENGWTEDSPMARAYERRVMQPEATGWIGLANPFATFAAIAATIGFAGLLFPGRGERPRWPWGLLLAAGVVTAILCGSKGGLASLGLGIMLVLAARFVARLSKLGWLVGVGVPLGVLAAVVFRGVLADRLGELSIYFRYMYAQAALRIFSQHPVTGIGPAGFKDAYLLAKNPLNPEEVTSPHSVFLDYLATLGSGGIAWIILLMCFAKAAGRSLFASDEEPDLKPAERDDCRRVIAIFLIPMLIALWFETLIATPEELLVRLGGLVIACIVSVLILKHLLSTRMVAVALGASALVAIAHGQIELTPILPQTAMLFAMILAANPPKAQTAAKRGGLRTVPIALIAACTAFVTVSLIQWQSYLGGAARAIEPLSTISQLLKLAQSDPRALNDAAAIAAAQTGQSVSAQPDAIRSAAARFADRALTQATAELDAAALVSNSDPLTLRAASQFYLQTQAKDATRTVRAEQLAQQASESVTNLGLSSSYAWVGTVQQGLYLEDKDKKRLTAARDAYEHAAKLDPFSLQPVVKLVELSAQLQDSKAAKTWAKKALELHDLTRYDPLKGLSAQQLQKMKQVAENP